MKQTSSFQVRLKIHILFMIIIVLLSMKITFAVATYDTADHIHTDHSDNHITPLSYPQSLK